MPDVTVCAAVVVEPSGASGERVLEAVAAQRRPPNEVLPVQRAGEAAGAAPFGNPLQSTAARGADWFWLLDGTAVPQPDALERLLEALGLPDLPEPVLLAGKIVLPDGALDIEGAPWPRLTNKDVAIAACQHHLVSIRAARYGSMLVSRAALELHGPPRDDLGWTAQILREGTGLLVPQSVAVREAPVARNPWHDVRLRAAMLRGPAWGGEEKLWVGFLVAQDAARLLLRRGEKPVS